jgi:predicted transcriptional regulator of viral defense system
MEYNKSIITTLKGVKYVTLSKLTQVVIENGGVLTPKQAKAAGISHTSVMRAVKAGKLERVAHGVYEAVDEPDDPMYTFQVTKLRVVFSHDTALFLHGLADRDPLSYCVTVPTGYNTKTLKEHGCVVFSIQQELYEIGLCKVKTNTGHELKTYNPERTLCDCLRSRSRMDAEVMTEAIKRYTRLKDRKIDLLTEYAKQFGVRKILHPYLEALL